MCHSRSHRRHAPSILLLSHLPINSSAQTTLLLTCLLFCPIHPSIHLPTHEFFCTIYPPIHPPTHLLQPASCSTTYPSTLLLYQLSYSRTYLSAPFTLLFTNSILCFIHPCTHPLINSSTPFTLLFTPPTHLLFILGVVVNAFHSLIFIVVSCFVDTSEE